MKIKLVIDIRDFKSFRQIYLDLYLFLIINNIKDFKEFLNRPDSQNYFIERFIDYTKYHQLCLFTWPKKKIDLA